MVMVMVSQRVAWQLLTASHPVDCRCRLTATVQQPPTPLPQRTRRLPGTALRVVPVC